MQNSRTRPLAAAVLFAAAFIVAVFAQSTPHFDAPDATWVAYWNDHSHRVVAIVQLYAGLVAGGALVWFGAQLASRLGSRAIYAAGWASAALLWVSEVLFSATPAAMSISGSPPAGGELDRIMTDMGAAALTVFSVPVACFLVAVACVKGLRSGSLPRTLCWLGLPVAVIVTVGGPMFMPLPLLPLWILAAGIGLGVRREPAASAAAAPA